MELNNIFVAFVNKLDYAGRNLELDIRIGFWYEELEKGWLEKDRNRGHVFCGAQGSNYIAIEGNLINAVPLSFDLYYNG